MKKPFITLCFVFITTFCAEAQNISNVTCRQNGESIVVNYDIDKAAETIELYVSRDGGNYFMGPLKKISGDVSQVSKGHKEIVWNVLDEFDAFTGENIIFEVRPTKTMASTQRIETKTPKVKFQLELGGFGGYEPYITNEFGGGMECNMGLLLNNKHHIGIFGDVETPNTMGYFGVEYRYYTKPVSKSRFWFGIECGLPLRNGVYGMPWLKLECAYSPLKWITFTIKGGCPMITAGATLNIASFFYKN